MWILGLGGVKKRQKKLYIKSTEFGFKACAEKCMHIRKMFSFELWQSARYTDKNCLSHIHIFGLDQKCPKYVSRVHFTWPEAFLSDCVALYVARQSLIYDSVLGKPQVLSAPDVSRYIWCDEGESEYKPSKISVYASNPILKICAILTWTPQQQTSEDLLALGHFHMIKFWPSLKIISDPSGPRRRTQWISVSGFNLVVATPARSIAIFLRSRKLLIKIFIITVLPDFIFHIRNHFLS